MDNVGNPLRTHQKDLGVEPSTFFLCFGYNLFSCFIRREKSHCREKKQSEAGSTAVQHFSEKVQSFHHFQGTNAPDWPSKKKRNKSLASVAIFFPQSSCSHCVLQEQLEEMRGHQVAANQEQRGRDFQAKNRDE